MSETKPVLTEKQRAWANAFLKAMGGVGSVDVKLAPPPEKVNPVKGPTVAPPKPELGGKLGKLDEELTEDLRSARDQLAGKGEIDISRKKVLGRSSDKGFKTGVVAAVDKLMEEVDRALSKGGPVDERALGLLREKLVTEQKKYQDGTEGEKNRALREQRQRKVTAIQTRIDGLDRLVKASRQQGEAREDAVTQMNPEERAKMLQANPGMLNAVIAAKPPAKELGEMLALLDGSVQNEAVKALMDAHGNDAGYMELICETVVGGELAKAKDQGTFLRSDNIASKVTTAYSKGAQSQSFLKSVAENTKEWLRPSRRIEIDPTKGADEDLQKRSVAELVHYMRALLRSLIGTEVPRPIAVTSSMIAEGARKNGVDPAIMVGGHVFLRVINPMLVSMPGLDANQRRAMVLATKLLQNASNGITRGGKEEFMELVAEAIEEEIPDLHRWFLQIAEQGDKLRGTDDLDQEVAMGGTTRRDALLLGLENPGLKLEDYFAAPSESDVLGIKPLYPDTRIGALILTASAVKPEPKGLTLPASPLQKQSHAKLVERERKAVIAEVIKRLKADKPKGREEGE
ncbi:MAG: hypothetical protein ACP5NP_12950 [Acetobacteraceae bacterium]